MAASLVQICNMALMHIGISETISATTERSKAANICALWLDIVRDDLLEAFDWGFARKRQALALTTSAVTNWTYAYAYPTDCVKARAIVPPGLRNPRADQRIAFEKASTGSQTLLLSDQPDAELIYTVRVTDPNLYTASFVHAYAAALAARIAMPMTVAPSVAANAAKLANDALNLAISNDASEEQPDQPQESEFIAARY